LASILDILSELSKDAAYPYAQGMLVESLRRMGHDPELVAVSEKVAAVQRRGLTDLLECAIDAGQVDATLDPDHTAGWLMTVVDACYLNAEPGHDPSPEVRRTAQGYLRPGYPKEPDHA
ncbi:MAG TPA: TetR/AcrR family transcriptional regulator, partial [Candidatus Avipropionibacterium avicola]|nr:TetR/AcrR family transcriptional regulator [Candidatus Avipropionibacterium avicola]